MKRQDLKRWLFIPDCHVPFHDHKAFKLVLKVAREFGFENVVSLGDFADFYSVSAHSKDPARKSNLLYEVEAVCEARSEIDAVCFGDKWFVEGNHCYRLQRYISDKAPELFGLTSVPKLFDLKANGWRFVPYKDHVQIGKLHITHDLGKAGKDAHRDAMHSFQSNAVIGHTHRLGYCVEGNAKGQAHVGAMFGWLGDAKQADYMHKIRANRDWALGFGIGYQDKGGNMYLTPCPIVNYKVLVEGNLVD